jgi:hypothetical protein
MAMSRLSIISGVILAALLIGAGIVLNATAPTVAVSCRDRPCQAN